MFLDDFIEGCQDSSYGVIRRSVVSLRVPTGQLLHQVVEVEDGPRLQVLDQRRQQVVNLLAAVLQLGRLPDTVQVGVGDLPLHGKKVEDDVGLFYNLQQHNSIYSLTV